MTMLHDKLIITAASKAYGPSLLALLGSLNLNWTAHPPVRVYDIGLDDDTLAVLQQQNIEVIGVPPFCPHWRSHFTWKVWCWNDAPARNFIWMDAGLVVLKPLDEVWETLERQGYFITSTKGRMMDNVSVQMCRGCEVEPEFRVGKETLSGTLVGMNKEQMQTLVRHALRVVLNEESMNATTPLHRHDTALISVLLYKYLHAPQIADAHIYAEWNSPRERPEQKVWVHRRAIDARDQKYLAEHISKKGPPYLPRKPYNWRARLPIYKVRRWLAGRDPRFIYHGVRD